MTTRICPRALGAILRARREALGHDTTWLAEQLSTTVPCVMALENGRYELKPAAIRRTCRHLSCDPAHVLALATVTEEKE